MCVCVRVFFCDGNMHVGVSPVRASALGLCVCVNVCLCVRGWAYSPKYVPECGCLYVPLSRVRVCLSLSRSLSRALSLSLSLPPSLSLYLARAISCFLALSLSHARARARALTHSLSLARALSLIGGFRQNHSAGASEAGRDGAILNEVCGR